MGGGEVELAGLFIKPDHLCSEAPTVQRVQPRQEHHPLSLSGAACPMLAVGALLTVSSAVGGMAMGV